MFSGRKSVKVDKQLYEKLTEAAGQKGYSSTEEFVQHLLERAVEGTSQDDLDQQQAEQQLRGLGYLE
ncbi:MAG: ribbon-helix-helix domain-containing protein [Pirellulaceae bacterium]|nr:ribbon-helix-helix domain-containing protein [Pirellulaceae bacterium]